MNAIVLHREFLSPTVFLVRFKVDEPFSWVPGQFLQLWFPFEQHGIQTKKKKCYTIASIPNDNNTFEVAVKVVDGGMTSNLLSRVQPEDSFEMQGPKGHFNLRDDGSEIVFLGVGTGVSPYRALLQQLVKEGFSRKVTLLFGVRSEKDLFFHDEFSFLAQNFENFTYVPVLSRPSSEWVGKKGYVQHHLKEFVKNPEKTSVYFCGLSPMIKACIEESTNLGIPKELQYREVYS